MYATELEARLALRLKNLRHSWQRVKWYGAGLVVALTAIGFVTGGFVAGMMTLIGGGGVYAAFISELDGDLK